MRRFILVVLLGVTCNVVCAQQPKGSDSVYYLLDTAKTSVNDQMWNYWEEGKDSGYFLNCHCNPARSNPIFCYKHGKHAIGITKLQLSHIKLTSLNDLIDIAAQYGANIIGPKVFYFIKPIDNKFIMYEFRLQWYRKPIIIEKETEQIF